MMKLWGLYICLSESNCNLTQTFSRFHKSIVCVDIPSLHPAGSVCHYGISQRVIHNLHGERSHCRSHTCSPQCSCLHCSASLQTITASCLSRTRQTCMLQFTYIHFQSKVLDLYKMFNVFKRSLFCLLLITITI